MPISFIEVDSFQGACASSKDQIQIATKELEERVNKVESRQDVEDRHRVRKDPAGSPQWDKHKGILPTPVIGTGVPTRSTFSTSEPSHSDSSISEVLRRDRDSKGEVNCPSL